MAGSSCSSVFPCGPAAADAVVLHAIVSSSGFAGAPRWMVVLFSEYALMNSTTWCSNVRRFQVVFQLLTHDESQANNRCVESPYRTDRLRIRVDDQASFRLLRQHEV